MERGFRDMGLLTMILWCAMGLLIACQYASYCVDLKWWEQVIVCGIFLIGGPIFVLANVFESILGAFLPDGWDDDDGSVI